MSPDHRLLGLLLLLLLVSGVTVHAAQLVVSPDGTGSFRTIQGAIDAAQHGDSIYVNPGVYEEQIAFRDGLHITGAGPEHTVVRYGYGFDEVLSVRHASSGTIEGMRLERTGSILSAPAVVLESASILLSNCEITGGQEAGIEISGATSRPSIQGVSVFGNVGHGIHVVDGASPSITDSQIRDNGGCGILSDEGTDVAIHSTLVSGNALTGIALERSATARVMFVEIEGHGDWAIHAAGSSMVEIADVRLEGNTTGGLLVSDGSIAELRRFVIRGGGTGIELRDRATASVEEGSISGTSGDGVTATTLASLDIRKTEIAYCGGHGVNLSSSQPCLLDHLTIAENAGDGILLQGSSTTATNTIIARNLGAGLRVAAIPSSSATHNIHHNALWQNGDGNHEGLARRPSDITAPPGFVNPASGDFTLLPDSPCIGAGTWGETIGSQTDPARDSGSTLDLTLSGRDPFLGAVWSARTLWNAPSISLAQVDLATRLTWSDSFVAAHWNLIGQGGKAQAAAQLALPEIALPWDEHVIPAGALSAGFLGVLSGEYSWSELWLASHFHVEGLTASSKTTLSWPSNEWSHRADILFGSGIEYGLHLGLVNLSPSSLGGSIHFNRDWMDSNVGLLAEVALFPDRRLRVEARWEPLGLSAAISALTYLERPGRLSLFASLAEQTTGLQISADAQLDDFTLETGSLAIRGISPATSWSVEFALRATGSSRLALRLEADLFEWLTPPPNQPPIPSWSLLPEDPEAGEVLQFDAGASHDPDGDILETWWDFGDGELGLGERVEHVYTEPGTYEISLTVSDNDGDPASIHTSLVIWEANSAPAASFTWVPITPEGTVAPRAVRAGDAIRLDGSESYAPSGDALEYAWDLGSDGVFDRISSDPIWIVPALPAGNYPTTLRVADPAGRSDAVLQVLVISEPNAPQADFVFTPTTPSILDPVRFIDRSIDADGTVVAWQWSFGDGLFSRDREPIHQFPSEGSYQVSLTVIDDSGLEDHLETTIDVAQVPGIVPVDEVWALVIGISDYEDVSDLDYASKDAIAMAEWALGAGVPVDHIRLLTDGTAAEPESMILEARPATLVNVREGLGWLRRMAGQDDLVLIYFSGHGYRGADDDGDEHDGVDEFFVLLDTRAAAVDDTALRDDEFGRFLDRIESEHVLVLFDGCHSGGLSRSLPSGRRPIGNAPDRFSDLSLEGRLILSATGEDQDAFESPALEHGVFTHFVLQGLQGSADLNSDHRVTAWELFEFVRKEVPEFVRTERGSVQLPQITGEGETRVIVATASSPADLSLTFEPAVPYAGGPVTFIGQASGEDSDQTLLHWSFGDGSTASGETVTHTFAEAGTFEVSLTSPSPSDTSPANASAQIPVGPPGQIIRIDPETGLALVSLGSQNGLRLGDRFVARTGQPPYPRLEVIELVDLDTAACLLIDADRISEIATDIDIQAE